MKRKGFTLVEIVVAIGLIGIIGVAFFPLLSFSYVRLFDSKRYTFDLFNIQQQVEQRMEIARSSDAIVGDPDVQSLQVFGKNINVHTVKVDIKSATSTAHGKIVALVPKNYVVYNVPEIGSVSLTAYDNNTQIANPSFLFPVDNGLSFIGTNTGIISYADDFLLNIYRWYMSPVMSIGNTTPPTDVRDWIILKEWNEARTPLPYSNSSNLTFIPNIESNYDKLYLNEFNFLDPMNTEELIADKFAGRYFVYSVTPYSMIGRVGEEKFSNPISTNRIDSIRNTIDNTITVSIEWIKASTYVISDHYPTVQANMINGGLETVNVTWAQSNIAITRADQPDTTVNGTVVGYPDGVKLILRVVDNIDNSPGMTSIAGPIQVNKPTSGAATYQYSAIVYDQFGNLLPDELVNWTLQPARSGISININSGLLTINSTALTGPLTIRATSATNSLIFSDLIVSVTSVGQVADANSSASKENLITPRRCSFTASVKDSNGNIITGLSMSDFTVSHITSSTAGFQDLNTINNYWNYEVTDFNDRGNGEYSWVIRRTDGTSSTRNDVEVQARNPGVSVNYVKIQTNLDSVRVS